MTLSIRAIPQCGRSVSLCKSLRGTDKRRGSVKGFNDRCQFMGGAAAAALGSAGLRPQSAAAHDAFSGYDGIGQAQLVRSFAAPKGREDPLYALA